MAKWANQLVLAGGSDLIRTRAGTAARVKQHVIKAYALNDSYATVIGNTCGSIDMVAGDFVQSGAAGAAGTTTIAAKAVPITANSGAAPNLYVAVVDSVSSDVLYVTDETSDQVLTAGGTATVPAYTYAVLQPV